MPHSEDTPILASDAERDRTVARVRDAVGEGRLTLEEFSERVGAAQLARTDRDLASLARDLPASLPGLPGVPGLPGLQEASEAPAAPASPGPVTEHHRATFSHLTRQGPWSLPARSSWRSLFGTIDLDLREARLADAETVLQIHNVFGTVTVVVPDGIEVIVRGGGLFASQKVQSPAQAPLPGGPRLIIDSSGPGGTLHVRARPTLGETLRARLGTG
jgi:hypothetical protein